MKRTLLLFVALAAGCGVSKFDADIPDAGRADAAVSHGLSGFGGFGDGPAPDPRRPDGAGGFGGSGAWNGGGGNAATHFDGGAASFGGSGANPNPPPDHGPNCNMANGQGCFCSPTLACPAGSTCMDYNGGPGFCGATCTPHAFGATCNLLPGVPGAPECFWNRGDGSWGCAIQCNGTGCPAGFHMVDIGGWAHCACVR